MSFRHFISTISFNRSIQKETRFVNYRWEQVWNCQKCSFLITLRDPVSLHDHTVNKELSLIDCGLTLEKTRYPELTLTAQVSKETLSIIRRL